MRGREAQLLSLHVQAASGGAKVIQLPVRRRAPLARKRFMVVLVAVLVYALAGWLTR